jgi:hypothetical protein
VRARKFCLCIAVLFCLLSVTAFGQATAKYPTLSWQQFEARGPSAGMRMFFHLLGNDLPMLDDADVLRNFMAANNCQNTAFPKLLNSEFDYPGMAAFYKSNAAEILKGSPTSLSILLKGFYLGEYDASKGVFPFVGPHGEKKTTVFHDLEPGNDLHDACPMLNNNSLAKNREFYATYLHFQVNVQPVTISDLPMDEASARSFVGSLRFGRAGAGRPVALLVDMDMLQTPTKLGPRLPTGGYSPNLGGRINKITVFSVETNKNLGVIVP